ncbi:hypothetical protein BURK1_03225 [Burkholderiales bacterium]|nr:hypothetical protein BURK1_03225 [Burkholderiales bacterium]
MAITLCPVAIAVGCRKCPVFRICPVKGVIGDQRPGADASGSPADAPTQTKRASKPPKPRAKRNGGRSRPRRRAR